MVAANDPSEAMLVVVLYELETRGGGRRSLRINGDVKVATPPPSPSPPLPPRRTQASPPWLFHPRIRFNNFVNNFVLNALCVSRV